MMAKCYLCGTEIALISPFFKYYYDKNSAIMHYICNNCHADQFSGLLKELERRENEGEAIFRA
jgi:uncharacterized protein YlaI